MAAEILLAAQLKSTDSRTVRNMMKRPMIQINDEVREMNDDELAEYEARVAKDLANEAAKEAEIKAKTEAKTAAEAKLVALGLDLDDLKALGL